MNDFMAIYIAAKHFFGGARWYFPADGKLDKSSAKIFRNSLAELLFRLTKWVVGVENSSAEL